MEKPNQGLMTTGSITNQLLKFAMPLLLGNMFQQFYNAVDSAVVGQFVGKEALAAVGSSASMINLVVSLFMGIAIGGTVCVSQYYGANNTKALHNAVHTIMAFSIVAGILMSFAGFFLARNLLQMMGTPDDVIDLSVSYFRVFFAGHLGLVLYNMGGGLLRAVGDSKRPLYYLIFSSILNVIFDLLFVALFGMGVVGAATATIVAQTVSAVLVLHALMKTKEPYKLIIRDIRFYKSELKKVVRIGLPSGVQNSIVSISNVFVQSSINLFGSTVVAGCGAYTKIDGFIILPAISFSMALTTFIGQNIGAGQYDRVKEGLKKGTAMSLGTIFVIVAILQFTVKPMLYLFSGNPEVVNIGIMYMRIESAGYLLLALTQTLSGVLRGAGLTKIPMFVMIGCWCGLRLSWIFMVARPMKSLPLVLTGYPISWLVSAVILVIYIKKVDWIHYYEKNLK